MIPVHKCFNLLVHNVFWAMREELKEDRFEGGLTEEEKHWASTKSAIRKEFRAVWCVHQESGGDGPWCFHRRLLGRDTLDGVVGGRGSQRRAASSDRRVAWTIVAEMSDFKKLANKAWSVKGLYEL